MSTRFFIKRVNSHYFTNPNYNPEALVDHLKAQYNLSSAGRVALLLGIDSTAMSRVRSRERKLNASMVLTLHETTGMPIQQIRELIGVPNAVF